MSEVLHDPGKQAVKDLATEAAKLGAIIAEKALRNRNGDGNYMLGFIDYYMADVFKTGDEMMRNGANQEVRDLYVQTVMRAIEAKLANPETEIKVKVV